MKYALLKQVLEEVEAFEQTRPSAGAAMLADFAAWLHTRTTEVSIGMAQSVATPRMSAEAEIGKLIVFMNRYARSYIRLGLAGTPLLTPDDFAYLATVLGHQPLSKTEVIARNVHEKASGTEVIKRLLAHGLVAEQAHATDRRSKLLTVTEAGMGVLGQVFGRMDQAAQLIAGDLTPDERAQLLYLLQKLDAFHHPIYAGARPGSFEQLLRHLPSGSGNKPA
ncbi:MarR family transcriptional regulator [Hymenobacter sp. BT175]|uniref:MarR family winged helix-turn-helix transcriptional regulator n=1 Tax=Hymenobacter translucens TaxID=2886507 RepID=UPI001D0EEF96|nr:MarR family transcriptional regulator [Hymenobacter translucens]MCC2546591.1 MarR family transcriptional regulator [Hymenobacter translucens]